MSSRGDGSFRAYAGPGDLRYYLLWERLTAAKGIRVTHIIHRSSDNPSPESILPAIEILKSGGIVAYPTETFYGLGVDAFNRDAIQKIFSIKKRQPDQPLLILIPDREVLSAYVKNVPKVAVPLMDAFWPGPLTLIFPAAAGLPQVLCANTGTIAIRISPHSVSQALVEAFGGAITSTSANISGKPSPVSPEEVIEQLGDEIDLVLDGGRTAGEKPSTIVDVTTTLPRLVREGAIPFDSIRLYF